MKPSLILLPQFSLIQTCYQVGTVMMMAVGILAATPLSPIPSLQALPLALTVVGNFAALFPASAFMARFGRKTGLLLGLLLGAAGVATIAVALVVKNFPLVCGGFVLYGFHQAFLSYLRFMAMESAGPEKSAGALSWILLGGIPAAFLGPLFGLWGKDLWPQGVYVGSFILLLAVMALQTLFVLLLPRRGRAHPTELSPEPARPWPVRLADGPLWLAFAASSFSFGLMVMLMAASPLAMHHHGHSHRASTLVLQAHVLGMYVPSFFSGALVKKFGPRNLILAGLAIIGLEMATAFQGPTFLSFLISLTLLGVGWNFLYVGGTNLLVTRYRPSEKSGIQALNDSFVCLFGATATFSAGAGEISLGWLGLQLLIAPMLLILLALLFLTRPRLVTES